VREVFLFGPGPELADVVVGLDGLVPELEAVLGPLRSASADVERSHHVAEVIELDRSTRRVGKVDCFEGRHEFFLVVRLSARRPEGGVDDLAVDVNAGGIKTGNRIEIFQDGVDEAFVAVALEVERVGAC
jgi:hypothetical protein